MVMAPKILSTIVIPDRTSAQNLALKLQTKRLQTYISNERLRQAYLGEMVEPGKRLRVRA